jgi:glutathione synthase/RimK-type ligase-like ATP-grasp enzyme
MTQYRPIAVYYEHPEWFRPLFDELDRRGIRYEAIDVADHRFDPAVTMGRPDHHPLLFNRMSPSAWQRGHGSAVLYTLNYLTYLAGIRAPVFNGVDAFRVDISKALQVSLLEGLALPFPRTLAVHRASLLPSAAERLTFPLVVKPNVGGSGAGIVRFDTSEALVEGVAQGAITSGLDGTLVLQEYHPPRTGSIVRVETLGGRYLYGIRVHIGEETGFNLCPADFCRTGDGNNVPSEVSQGSQETIQVVVERYDPPPAIRRAVERIAAAAGLDVGGVEYLESDRDGRLYYYDINALSNFVADPVPVLGFDPTRNLVDALLGRAAAKAA